MLTKYLLPLITLLLLSSSAAVAQHSVRGKVVDKAGNPVPYANVVLLEAEDSTTVVKGTFSEEYGDFLFENVAPNSFLLRISFVGFQDLLEEVVVANDVNLGSFELSEAVSSLDEVSINVRNPSVRREVDRLVFNVENTSLSSGTTWDILRRTPGVILANGNLQVRNQAVQVYINDRRVQLSSAELRDLLENYSAENIKSVEVIMNPPARYDAEGGAILNIVTSKGIVVGYKGSVNAALTQAIFPKYTFGTSHYHKTDRLDLFANYSFNPRKEFKEDESYINFMNDTEGVFSRWETDFDRTTRSRGHNVNLILDYDLGERNKLSFAANALYSPNKTFQNRVNTSIQNFNGEDSSFLTESSLKEDQSNIGLDLEYRHQLAQAGAEFSAKAHYTRYDQNRIQDVETDYFNAGGSFLTNNSFFTDASQHINIFTGQIDYVTPLGGTGFEAGLKASSIDSESGIAFYDVFETPEYNPGLSDNFLYDENIYAGYVSMAKDWTSWSVKGGLRGEYTAREGVSRSMDQVDDREYFELFPTFYLMHTLSESHSLTFDYSRRIQRPRYESLNPFRYFLNEHNYNAGNPNLRAAISNNFNLNYTLKGQYFFDLYYRDNGPSTETLSFQDNENQNLRNVSVNLLESLSYGLDVTHGRSLANWWYAYGYFSLFHEEQTFLALESGDVPVTNDIDAFYGMLYNSFTLSKNGTFTGELSFIYVSDFITGSYNFDPMTTLSVGFRKTLWDSRAEVTLNFEDILNRTNTWLRSNYLNQDNGFFAQPESRYVRVGFKYNFGNFRLSDNQRTMEAEERERL